MVSPSKVVDAQGTPGMFTDYTERFLGAHVGMAIPRAQTIICDRPRENRPSSHLGMIVEIPILKVLISITSFCLC